MQILDSTYIYRNVVMPSGMPSSRGGDKGGGNSETELNGCIKEVSVTYMYYLLLVYDKHVNNMMYNARNTDTRV